MNGRTKIKNETCFVVARKEQHKNKHEGLKKKKIEDWVETKKAGVLGAQIII